MKPQWIKLKKIARHYLTKEKGQKRERENEKKGKKERKKERNKERRKEKSVNVRT